MPEARMRYALIAICLACLLGSGAALYAGHQAAPPPVTITGAPPSFPSAPPPYAKHDTALSPKLVYVDVAGAVQRPTLYALPTGCRVMQAVMAAGGPTPEADLDAVNLAELVKDGEKVTIPKKQAPAALLPENSLPSALVMPARVSKNVKVSAAAKSGKLISPDQGQIGLNTATAEDLERLPSVGPAMAARIIAHRQSAGSFKKIEDLRDVQGIGPKKFAKISPLVTLD